MERERIDQALLTVMNPYKGDRLPEGFSNLYVAISSGDGVAAVNAFTKTEGWGGTILNSASLRLTGKIISELFEPSKDHVIESVHDAFKLQVHFDEEITKALLLTASVRARLLNGVSRAKTEIFNDEHEIVRHIEASKANQRLILGTMKLYGMLPKNISRK